MTRRQPEVRVRDRGVPENLVAWLDVPQVSSTLPIHRSIVA